MILKSELQYFPPVISYITLLKATYIEFCVYDSWERQRFRNRMMVAGANGLLLLSIPVAGGRNQKGAYRDIRIDHRSDWQQRHWRSLFSAYGKSPWFFQYADALESLFRFRDDYLVDWNLRCLAWTASALKLPGWAGKILTAAVDTPDPGDVVADSSGLVLPSNFQDPALGPFPRYTQVFEDRIGFQPNLSVLDLLLCCGPQSRDILLNDRGLYP
jgi:hypothetical protein